MPAKAKSTVHCKTRLDRAKKAGRSARPCKYAGEGPTENSKNYLGLKTPSGRNRAVWDGRAQYTVPGGLQKHQLMESKSGKIVSIKKHEAGIIAMKRMKESGKARAPGDFSKTPGIMTRARRMFRGV